MSTNPRAFAIALALPYAAMGASGLVGQAINSLLKDRLSLSAADAAAFMAVASVPTYLGPLYALLSDSVPLLGSRRRSYLVLSGLVGAASWVVLGAQQANRYMPALGFLAAALLGLQFSTVVANGLMVESGKREGRTGMLQSIQWSAASAASLVATLCGGFLVERFNSSMAFRAYAIFPLLSAIGAAALLRGSDSEPRRPSPREIGRSLRAAAQSSPHWAITVFLFAWFFSPGVGTALYYFERDALHFGPGYIGVLGAAFVGAGLPAAALYAWLSRRLPVSRLLGVAVTLGTLGHLSYLAMSSPATAFAACAADGALSLFAMLAVFDIGARLAPSQFEGTAFSLLTSARIIAVLAAGVVGGKLYDAMGFHALVAISAASTACCGLLVPWISSAAIARPRYLPAIAPSSS